MFKKSSIQVQAQIKPSKPSKSIKRGKPTSKGKKCLKTSVNSVKRKEYDYNTLSGEEKKGIIPPRTTISVGLFVGLMAVFVGFKRYLIGLNGGRNVAMVFDLFVLLVGVYCSGSVGITVTGLGMMLYNGDGGAILDSIRIRLSTVSSYGLVNKVGNRYFITVQAENLFREILSTSDIRYLDDIVKEHRKYYRYMDKVTREKGNK